MSTNRQIQIDRFALLAHQFACQRLREQPARIAEVREVLGRWHDAQPKARSRVLWEQWRELLSGSALHLEQTITARTDKATLLRSVSPMSVLITPNERTQLFQQAREAS
jgi:hypothetical protein